MELQTLLIYWGRMLRSRPDLWKDSLALAQDWPLWLHICTAVMDSLPVALTLVCFPSTPSSIMLPDLYSYHQVPP